MYDEEIIASTRMRAERGRGEDETTFFWWLQLALSHFEVVMEVIHFHG